MYRHSAICSAPEQPQLSPQLGFFSLISQPGVNFTACNLHMFIYRNVICVISASALAACSSAHMRLEKKHTLPQTKTYSE